MSALVIWCICLLKLFTYGRAEANSVNQIRELLREQSDLGLHCLTDQGISKIFQHWSEIV